MLRPLSVKALGMISALGVGAEFNAAAMRCGYDGFESADNIYPDKTGLHIAQAPLPLSLRGNSRFKEMVKRAVADAHLKIDEIALCVCMPHLSINGATAIKDTFDSIIQGVMEAAPTVTIRKGYGFSKGRASFGFAIQKAQDILYNNKVDSVLIVGVDSLLSPNAIRYYLEGSVNRLLTDKNSNGFIPGEAAVAVLCGKPKEGISSMNIASVGFGEEPVGVYSEDVLKAVGMTKSTFDALEPLGIYADDTDFRISSVSGESYFFKELTLTHTKTMKKSRTDHPLWHPADSIGEVGAAVGGAMLVMAEYAFKNKYAPGKKALCHLSNDSSERVTFILESYRGTSKDAS